METKKDVVTSSYSQQHVLQHRMREEHLTHDETVMANLSPVRLEVNGTGDMVMYFCPLQSLDVIEKLNPGDGGPIPEDVKIEGFKVPIDTAPGLYNLSNVKLHSNGTMQVIATENTQFSPFK